MVKFVDMSWVSRPSRPRASYQPLKSQNSLQKLASQLQQTTRATSASHTTTPALQVHLKRHFRRCIDSRLLITILQWSVPSFPITKTKTQSQGKAKDQLTTSPFASFSSNIFFACAIASPMNAFLSIPLFSPSDELVNILSACIAAPAPTEDESWRRSLSRPS